MCIDQTKRFRRDLIARLAPIAPPCFDTRMQWVEYLTSAAEAQKDSRGPLLFEKGQPVRINPRYRQHCHDCLPAYAQRKQAQGKCDPKRMEELTRRMAEALHQEIGGDIDIVALAARKEPA